MSVILFSDMTRRKALLAAKTKQALDTALSTVDFDDDDIQQLEVRLNQLLSETLTEIEMSHC